MEKQEISTTAWLNFILSPDYTHPVSDAVVPAASASGNAQSMAPIKFLVKWSASSASVKHRVEAQRIFASQEAKLVIQRLLLEVNEGRIGIR
jgi:hypothetical protein